MRAVNAMRATFPTQEHRTSGQAPPLALSLAEAERLRADFLKRELELSFEHSEARSREFFDRLDADRRNESRLKITEIEFAI